jgi:hypothetical protein
MTAADVGVQKLDVVGPQGLLHYLAHMRSFVYRSVILDNIISWLTAMTCV